MNNIKRSVKVTTSLVASLGLSLASVASAFAWGPERATFTMDEPATYPTFNSITDNPSIGDERDFVRVGQIDADVTQLANEVEVLPGHQYLVYMYFHNNASSTFNDSAHNHSGIALNTHMSASFPTIINKGEQGTITGKVTADNSNPTSVWDEAYLKANSKVYIHYVAGSAKIYNDWATNGTVLSDSLFTEGGTMIGLTSMNGAIPGCEEYHGVVSYVIQADSLDGTVDKTVSKDGENFAEEIEVLPGDELTYKLTIKNMGTKSLTNVTIKDTLPEKLSLVSGSVELWANDSTIKDKQSDDIVTNGLNLGTLGTGNVVYITYRAKISNDVDCGSIHLVNNAKLVYDNELTTGESDEDNAAVNVKKDGCNPPAEDCTTNPNLPECQRIPDTGPVEIILAIVIVLGLGGAGYYFYRTHKKVKAVEKKVSGKTPEESTKDKAPEAPKAESSKAEEAKAPEAKPGDKKSE